MDEAAWPRVFHLLFYTCLAMAITIATVEEGPIPPGSGWPRSWPPGTRSSSPAGPRSSNGSTPWPGTSWCWSR
ncbi:hypothetical protein ACFQ0B_29335 [Nonomuraea thailandensis]